MTATNRPKRRVVRTIITLLLGAASLVFAGKAIHQRVLFNRAQVAEISRVEIDLSKAGVYETPLSHTYGNSHGIRLEARLGDHDLPPGGKWSGLGGRYEIVDANGQVIESDSFGLMLDNADSRIYWLSRFPQFPVGHYTLRLIVVEPATTVVGTKQAVIARYSFCGLEALPILIHWLVAFLFGLPAVILGLLMLRDRLRHRKLTTGEGHSKYVPPTDRAGN